MRWIYLFLLSLLVSACGGGSQEPVPQQQPVSACPVADERRLLDAFMKRDYFWNDKLAVPDAQALTIDAYFESMLYKPLDRYSFTEPTADYEQRVIQGQRAGYGYTLAWTDAQQTELRVRSVEALGPAFAAGLRRGQSIASIDGYSLADIAAGKVPAVNGPGVTRTIVLRDTSGSARPINMVSAEFPLTIVTATSTFPVIRSTGETVPVGYLSYQSFVQHANGALGDAIAGFAEAGVREVVLDLRYNGGGSVAVSRDLASMIGGAKVRDQLYAYLRFNANNLVRNQSIAFRSEASALPAPPLQTVERLIVLTSPGTASASELLVNGLRPFMDVVLIGSVTYGKPYGSIIRHECGTTYHAIQFTTLNGEGKADYANGFTPECFVADDLDHELGDAREGRLSAALHYVKTGQCPAAPLLPKQAAAKEAQSTRGQSGLPVLGEIDPPRLTID